AILGLRNCGHSSRRLTEKWGAEKQEKTPLLFFLPSSFCQLMAPMPTNEIKPRIAGFGTDLALNI
ncbi:MAG: hypothetical protein ACREUY_04605, partial [Burkholderiales bacterium]